MYVLARVCPLLRSRASAQRGGSELMLVKLDSATCAVGLNDLTSRLVILAKPIAM